MAFNCTGCEEVIARLNGRGRHHQFNDVKAVGLRQIFTADPNVVLLELNFFGD